MKKFRILPFVAILFLLSSCGDSGNAQTEFWVRGNCDMCKENIETALNEVAGVASASYDLESHMANISYDSTKVIPGDLHQAIANAGYDTKEITAIQAAYDELPKCCKKPEDM